MKTVIMQVGSNAVRLCRSRFGALMLFCALMLIAGGASAQDTNVTAAQGIVTSAGTVFSAVAALVVSIISFFTIIRMVKKIHA